MNIIDIICLSLIVLIAFFGVIKGFFSVLFNFIAYVVSFIAAKIASGPISGYFYSSFIKEKIMVQLNKALPAGSVSGGIENAAQSLIETLPENLVKIIRFFGIEKFTDSGILSKSFMTVEQIENEFLSPIVTKVLAIITFIVIFIILSVILRVIVDIINKAVFKKKDGVMSTVNKIFGGILGLIKGLIPAACICLILDMLAPVIDNPGFVKTVGESFFCGLAARII